MEEDYASAKKYALEMADIFGPGNFYLELQDHGIEDQQKILPKLISLARELDIASYLGGSDIVQVFAVTGGRLAINVLAKLQNGISVSIEIGVGMPKGSEPFDRHEIIARRGVASDQTVDTHTAHSSIRCWGDKGVQDYTDVDTEIFGLTTEEVWTVRAAFALLQKRASAKIWNAAAKKAFRAADLAFESDKAMAAKKISLKNAVDTTAAVAMSEVR